MSDTKVCLLAKCHYKSADFMRFHHVRNSASNRHSCHSSLGLIRTDRITVTMDLNTHQSIRMHSFVLDKRARFMGHLLHVRASPRRTFRLASRWKKGRIGCHRI